MGRSKDTVGCQEEDGITGEEVVMKLSGPCPNCLKEISFEATPMNLEDTDGQSGFYEYDYDCPHCGYNVEGVIREARP
jgi:hypothetical protein